MPKKKAKKKKTKTKKRKPRAHGTDGRSEEGKFTKGNQCALNNKSHTNEKAKALKEALLDSVTEKDIKAIVKKMKAQAKAGDHNARKELFDRLWGRAPQAVEVSGEGGGPIPVSIVDYSKIDLESIKPE